MAEGGVIDFSEIPSASLPSILTNPTPDILSVNEYFQLSQICSELLGEVDKNSVVKIQSTLHPIYRSSDPISERERDSLTLNRPEIMARYLRSPDEIDISDKLNPSIFISIAHSCFKNSWNIDYCRELMTLWKEKIKAGLDAFIGSEQMSSPPIEIMVYSDIDKIGANPLKHYVDVIKKRPASGVLKKPLPSIFIDCSPASNHMLYQFDYDGKLPEFSLCFSLIDENSESIDKKKLDQITQKVGSGFIIFQKQESQRTMNSVSEALKIAAVLSARMLIGRDRETKFFFEHLSEGAFLETRKTLNSKSCSTKLDKTYKSCSHLLPSGIRNLSEGWVGCNGDEVYRALLELNRSLLHCKYESDDRIIRNVFENRIGDWLMLSYKTAEVVGQHTKFELTGNKNYSPEYRAAKNPKNSDVVVNSIRSLRGKLNSSDEYERKQAGQIFKKIKSEYLNKKLEVDVDLNILEFEEFYKKYSKLIFMLNGLYRIASPLMHTDELEKTGVGKLNNWGVHFHLSTRLKLYHPLLEYLDTYRSVLQECSKSNHRVATALKEALRLDTKKDEVVE